jgi:hypothetical protein
MIYIVGFLILSFYFVLSLAKYLDKRDEKTKLYLKDRNYDITQYYVVKFRKANFHKGIKFFRLYIFFIKVN